MSLLVVSKLVQRVVLRHSPRVVFASSTSSAVLRKRFQSSTSFNNNNNLSLQRVINASCITLSSRQVFSTKSQQQQQDLSAAQTSAVFDDLLDKLQNKRIVDKFLKDDRTRIPYSEFVETCTAEGLSSNETSALAAALHQTGLFLHFSTSHPLSNYLFLHPTRLASALLRMLDPDQSLAQSLSASTAAELATKRAELSVMQTTKASLDALAYRKADRVIALLATYLVLQGAAVARLTWWELSWDIMEPITYLLTFGGSMVAILYFTLNKTEFTYDALRETLARKRMTKLYAKNGFDFTKYEETRKAIEELERRLQHPENFLLESLGRPTPTPTPVSK